MNRKLQIVLLGFIALTLLSGGCTPNEADEEIEDSNQDVEVDDSINVDDTIADGYLLRVETLGHVHWDGVQVLVSNLGLEAGNVYEFTLQVMIPNVPDGGIGLLLQGDELSWIEIATSGALSGDEWHTITGMLDLSDVDELDFTYVQLVKDPNIPNWSENIILLLDELVVTLSNGEVVAEIDFANGQVNPFVSRGNSILMPLATEDIANIEFATPVWDLDLPSLAEIYAEYFLFGNILEPALIENNPSDVLEMFIHQYNAVTAENAMKPEAISGGGDQDVRPDALVLDGARAMVTFAEEHGLYMVGHTLIWHQQSAPWQYRDPDTGNFLTRAEAMENMRWFIEQYAGYFEGRIDAWDVVNEVFTNNGNPNATSDGPDDSYVFETGLWQRALRNYAPWYHAFANGADVGEGGWDYIYYAFVFARRYAPSTTLIYNDFNEEMPAKRDAIASMVEQLNERWMNDLANNPAYEDANHPDYGRPLIEAIGMQAHYNQGTNLQFVREALERFAETGAQIHITELDIQITTVVIPYEMMDIHLEQQANMFAQLFAMYMEFADYIDRVSIWGREDGSSWRGYNGATHFDRHLEAKPSFWAIVDPVEWLE